jgi:hypothetical protein
MRRQEKDITKESKTCPICNNQFLDYVSNHRKFCSRECSDKGRIKNGNSGEKWYQSMSNVDMGKYWRGKKNPNHSVIMKERVPWNKGLTKENSESVKKYVDKKIGSITTDEVKNKMSLTARKNIKNRIDSLYKKWHPNYNPNACLIIENYGKENGLNFQHAMNGGEVYIKELGYWLDGYDSVNNVVIEYNEKHHKRQTIKDEKRKKDIIEFLKCKFIEIWD